MIRLGRPALGRDIDILVAGEVNPDVVVSDPDPTPEFGEVERLVKSVHLTVGSSSAIFACGAARLGMRVALYGVVGDDPLGRFMLGALAERGVDVGSCTVDHERPTGASVILTSGHDRAILTAPGTIGAMDVDALPLALLDRARHLHTGCYFLQEVSRGRLPSFFAAARERGLTTSFDTNWDPSGAWVDVEAMLPACDVFLPNEAEARRISGLDDVGEAARRLARIGAAGRTDGGPVVVVKMGAAGALACRADGPVMQSEALPVDVVDTTGAGDSFDAGFMRAWLDGAPLQDALELGAACGALSTRLLGGVDGQPTLDEARAELEHWRGRW
jgi:sugar/nucleoside kinase (ribokinase family)